MSRHTSIVALTLLTISLSCATTASARTHVLYASYPDRPKTHADYGPGADPGGRPSPETFDTSLHAALTNTTASASPPVISRQGRNNAFEYTLVTTFPGRYDAALDRTFDILAGTWDSDVPVTVSIRFTPLRTGDGSDNRRVLGFARASAYEAVDDASLGLFQIAIAEALLGTDINEGRADENRFDIIIVINENIPWYLETDANPGSERFDLISVLLHETLHGLGFTGLLTARGDDGSAFFVAESPARYDQFLANEDGCSLLAFANSDVRQPSTALYEAVTSNNIFFADGNGRLVAPLFAPTDFSDGSSIYHVDLTLDGSPDDLMTPSLQPGYARHQLGNVTEAVLRILLDRNQVSAPRCNNTRNPDPRGNPPPGGSPGSPSTILGLSVGVFIAVVAGAILALLGLVGLVVACTLGAARSRSAPAGESFAERAQVQHVQQPPVIYVVGGQRPAQPAYADTQV